MDKAVWLQQGNKLKQDPKPSVKGNWKNLAELLLLNTKASYYIFPLIIETKDYKRETATKIQDLVHGYFDFSLKNTVVTLTILFSSLLHRT